MPVNSSSKSLALHALASFSLDAGVFGKLGGSRFGCDFLLPTATLDMRRVGVGV
jgi:hypothetical protein